MQRMVGFPITGCVGGLCVRARGLGATHGAIERQP